MSKNNIYIESIIKLIEQKINYDTITYNMEVEDDAFGRAVDYYSGRIASLEEILKELKKIT